MTIKVRLKAKSKGDFAEVKSLMRHPMETGQRMNKKTNKPYPAHFISNVKVSVNGKQATEMQWSGAISVNPYLAVYVKAKGGDKVTIDVVDNKGDKGTSSIKIK